MKHFLSCCRQGTVGGLMPQRVGAAASLLEWQRCPPDIWHSGVRSHSPLMLPTRGPGSSVVMSFEEI